MVRTTRARLYRQILSTLGEEPRNTHQLAERTRSHWETVRNALEILEEAGVVEQEGKRFKTRRAPLVGHPDALMELPVTESQERALCELANRCQELSAKPLDHRSLQKTLVLLIEREGLDLPHGVSLYGPTTALRLRPEVLRKHGSTKRYDAALKSILSSSREGLHEDRLASARLRADRLFKQPFTKENLELLAMELRESVFALEGEDDDKPVMILQAYYSTFCWMLKHPLERVEGLRTELFDAFVTVWDLVCAYRFYVSVKGTFKSDITPYYEAREQALAGLASEKLFRLQESWPPFPKLPPKLAAFRASLEGRSR